IQDLFKVKEKNGGSMYLFVQSMEEKQKLEKEFQKELGKDIVKFSKQITYSLQPRKITAILLSGSKMNRFQFTKCVSCSSTMNKSIYVIGSSFDLNTMKEKECYPRRDILAKWLSSICQ
ncbi:hypothetical protein LCGC14_2398490, partial [marine sediment metagenome]